MSRVGISIKKKLSVLFILFAVIFLVACNNEAEKVSDLQAEDTQTEMKDDKKNDKEVNNGNENNTGNYSSSDNNLPSLTPIKGAWFEIKDRNLDRILEISEDGTFEVYAGKDLEFKGTITVKKTNDEEHPYIYSFINEKGKTWCEFDWSEPDANGRMIEMHADNLDTFFVRDYASYIADNDSDDDSDEDYMEEDDDDGDDDDYWENDDDDYWENDDNDDDYWENDDDDGDYWENDDDDDSYREDDDGYVDDDDTGYNDGNEPKANYGTYSYLPDGMLPYFNEITIDDLYPDSESYNKMLNDLQKEYEAYRKENSDRDFGELDLNSIGTTPQCYWGIYCYMSDVETYYTYDDKPLEGVEKWLVFFKCGTWAIFDNDFTNVIDAGVLTCPDDSDWQFFTLNRKGELKYIWEFDTGLMSGDYGAYTLVYELWDY